VNKYSALLFVIIFSFLFGDANVQIRLQNGQIVQGEFVGTYMNHVHILVEEKIIYYACDDITSITYSAILRFDYDCSINTVTADILFPPELDPMTGEMTQMLPDVFNPDIPKPAAKVEDGLKLINKTPKQMKEEMGIKVEAGGVSTEEDFVVIDGVKYARELIKDQNDTDEIDIWNKKIPPSVYLEKLSNDLEGPSRFEFCSYGYLIFGFGVLFFSSADSNKSEGMRQFGNVMGTACIAGGLFVLSRILRIGPKGLKWIPKTDEGKQFENIKNIQDKNEKEKLAYESLVALAQKSRSTRQIGTVAGFPVTIIKNKHRPQMTIEEKALDDYLNQIPIVSAFKGVSTIP